MSASLILGFKEFVGGLINAIPKLMYFLCVTLMSVIDAMQLLIRKLSGLDTYYVDGVAQTGDIAVGFIKSIFMADSKYPALQNAFWALIIFGIILLIITTIISIVRQEYMPGAEDIKEKPKNNKIFVVGKSLKSLFMFLIVPVCCVLGLMFLDVIFSTIDSITTGSTGGQYLQVENSDGTKYINSYLKSEMSTNGNITYTYYDIFGARTPCTSTPFSGMMFKAAAYSSNRVRLNTTYYGNSFYDGLRENTISNFDIFGQGTREEAALVIDEAFANCFQLSEPKQINVGFMKDTVSKGLVWNLKNGKTIEGFSKYDIGLVFYFYDLWQFNFIIGFAFFVVCIKIFAQLIIGLMKRIIEMVALFIVCPPIIAIYPLDDGKSFGKWRENFMSKALAAAASIIGMNLLFLVFPYLNRIELFEDLQMLNLIFSSLFIIVGLTTIETFIAMVSKMIGADDVNKAGNDSLAKVGSTLAKAATLAGSAVGTALKFSGVGTAAGFALKGATKLGAAVGKRIYKGAANKLSKTKFGKSKFGQALGKKINNLVSSKNLFLSKAKQQEIQDEAEEAYKNGEAEKEFDQKVDAEEQYNNEIDAAWQAYAARRGTKKTKDEWLKTDAQAKRIRTEAEKRIGGGLTRGQYVVANKDKFIKDRVDSNTNKAIKQAKENKDYSNLRNGILKGVGRFSKYTGLNNLSTFGGLGLQEFKDSFVRDGKGGMMSMIMAFGGKRMKEIEEHQYDKKLGEEETARYRAQQKQLKKEKKQK